jgi:hypothetical protein
METIFVNGMNYGIGIDSLSMAVRGDGTVFAGPTNVSNAAGQKVIFSLDKIESLHELQTAFGVSGDDSASFAIFGGSAKTNFITSSGFNEYSVFLLARVYVVNAVQQIENVKFNTSALNLLKDGKTDRFREQFGDMFVLGMITGGEYYGLLELETRDEADKSALSIQLEAEAGFLGLGAEAEHKFTMAIQKAAQGRRIHIHSHQSGGSNTTSPTDPVNMAKKAQTFAQGVAGDMAVAYGIVAQDYKVLDIPNSPNWVDIQNAKQILRQILQRRNTLVQESSKIAYVLSHPTQFEPFQSKVLQQLDVKISDTLNEYLKAASHCVNHPAQAVMPEIPMPAFTLPARKGLGAPWVRPLSHPKVRFLDAKAFRQISPRLLLKAS